MTTEQGILAADAEVAAANAAAGMRWYVVHAYSGMEKAAERNIVERINRAGMQDKFGRILVPTEEVVEMKNGQRRTTERKVIARRAAAIESWYARSRLFELADQDELLSALFLAALDNPEDRAIHAGRGAGLDQAAAAAQLRGHCRGQRNLNLH